MPGRLTSNPSERGRLEGLGYLGTAIPVRWGALGVYTLCGGRKFETLNILPTAANANGDIVRASHATYGWRASEYRCEHDEYGDGACCDDDDGGDDDENTQQAGRRLGLEAVR